MSGYEPKVLCVPLPPAGGSGLSPATELAAAQLRIRDLELECTRRAQSEAELRAQVDGLKQTEAAVRRERDRAWVELEEDVRAELALATAQATDLAAQRDRACEALLKAEAGVDKFEPLLVDTFVSRDLVQRAFDLLTQFGAHPPTGEGPARAAVLLSEALGR